MASHLEDICGGVGPTLDGDEVNLATGLGPASGVRVSPDVLAIGRKHVLKTKPAANNKIKQKVFP